MLLCLQVLPTQNLKVGRYELHSADCIQFSTKKKKKKGSELDTIDVDVLKVFP